MDIPVSLETCERATGVAVALWALLSGFEWIAARKMFAPGGPYSWTVLSLRTFVFAGGAHSVVMGSSSTVVLMATVRLVAGAALLAGTNPMVALVASAAIALSCFYFNYRTCFGGDGSDQMGLVVSLGLLLISLGAVIGDRPISFAGAFWIGGQATLAYFAAGAAKVVSPVWRSGEAVTGVMRTQTYGHPWAARVTQGRPAVAFAVAWLVMATEMLFPAALMAPNWLLATALVGFAIFHISNAFFMGLNSFVPAFVATYPSIVLINHLLRQILG